MCAWNYQYIPREPLPMIKDRWLIRCKPCDDEKVADYDGTYWICRACGYRTDGPEGIQDMVEREYYRREYMRDKQERDFYKEFETPNDKDTLF